MRRKTERWIQIRILSRRWRLMSGTSEAPWQQIALEALKGVKTIQQIAKEFDVHPVQVSDWKKTMQEEARGVFEKGAGGGGTSAEEFEREREQLKAIIGDLTVKLEFVTKKSKQLGLYSGGPSL